MIVFGVVVIGALYVYYKLRSTDMEVPETAEVCYEVLSERQLLRELDMKLAA